MRLSFYLTPSEHNAIVAASNHDGASTISDWVRRKDI